MAAERDQGECEQRFRLAAGASLDGFWDFDVTGNVAHYSPRWQAMSPKELRWSSRWSG
jgi:PAS domain-containing protein